jgi:hypothetical protein
MGGVQEAIFPTLRPEKMMREEREDLGFNANFPRYFRA